jgi:shikimate kinase
MGSGKSTLGSQLATLMHRQFIDSDEEISRIEGRSVQAIFAEKGEKSFRELESAVLKKIAGLEGEFVVALGGGATCSDKNLRLVLTSGYVVYIQLPVPVLVSRLEKERTTRPLLSDLSNEQLPQYIEKKLKERETFYEQAHLMVNGINLGAPLLFEIICASVPQNHT